MVEKKPADLAFRFLDFYCSIKVRLKKDVQARPNLCYKGDFPVLNEIAAKQVEAEPDGRVAV